MNTEDTDISEQINNENTSNQEEIDVNKEPKSRFKPGQPLTFIRVRFPGNAKSFPFLVGKRTFSYGQKVLAMSDRGMDVGYINSFPYELPFQESMLPIKSIAKEATEEDLVEQKGNKANEKRAEEFCKRIVEDLDLNMIITHVEYIQFGKKAVFYFNAPERVDFRELVKRLVGELKMRIELRQISVRDRAAALGGVASCGLQTCCSSFLQKYGNVNIKMAKNQNLALIPSKLNGVCGQLKCCIKYEDEVYTEKRSRLPYEGDFVLTYSGDRGKVLKLNLIREYFDLLTVEGKKRRYISKQFKTILSPEEIRFPTDFNTIDDETSTIVGLEDEISDEQNARHLADEKMLEKYPDEDDTIIDNESDEFENDFQNVEASHAHTNRNDNRERRFDNRDGEDSKPHNNHHRRHKKRFKKRKPKTQD